MHSIKLTFNNVGQFVVLVLSLPSARHQPEEVCGTKYLEFGRFFFFLFHYVFFWQIVFYIQRDRDKTSFSQITWHIRKKKLQKNRKRCIFIQFMEYVITCVINALAVPAKILFFLLPWPMKKKNKKTHKHLYSFYFVVAKFRMFFF